MSRYRYRQRPGTSSGDDRRISRALQFPDDTTPVQCPVYTVATLPTVYDTGALVYVSDAAGGPLLAFYDGSNWKQANSPATTVT